MTTPKTIYAVVDVESDEPEVLGTYIDTGEGIVRYRDASGDVRKAPDDCVLILPLRVRLP